MKHAFAAPDLWKIGVFQSSDTINLVLLHGDSSVHLRRITDAEDTEGNVITVANSAARSDF
ncbi:hypothetical protein OUZ56_018997 [Daphnia magna]|uniref:Uncharacterized protein n=1 Tax=Daphnia magna TaxID=35525 RepID=A0ABQ9ZAD2_9CRUS|nr:hypothetical protein OUZ56_018986 [Daphnia magna]KAK4009846.1 hypothetical protein OUZ56_018991 [Daphnia magna]KAK4009852.1 hypothetical protein OUZ56_018997 [Daphnia magna]